MKLKRGIFITLEGVDGTGKSVSIHQLIKLLRAEHIPFKFAKETTMTQIGKAIRHIISTCSLNKHDQAVLFAIARKDCMNRITKPALHDHKLVICDRYLLSSLAYQSKLRKVTYNDGKTAYMDINHTLEINKDVVGKDLLNPDLNVYIYLDNKDNIKRLTGRKGKEDRIDRYLENAKHLEDLKARYNYAIKHSGLKCLSINGKNEAPVRAKIIFDHIMQIIKKVNG